MASFVRSLAGLDVLLKSVFNNLGLIVIDEPEMNAHPIAQLQLIELIAIMANLGCKIVITTHSPYIVDHLCNLMQASQSPKVQKLRIAGEFKLQDRNAFIDPQNVAVYSFDERGDVISILDRKSLLLDGDNFSMPSDYTTNLYSTLLQEQHNNKE